MNWPKLPRHKCTCKVHLRYLAERAALARDTRESRRVALLCPNCGKSEPGRYRVCEPCRLKKSTPRRRWRLRKTIAGLCYSCGKRRPDPGNNACETCLAQFRRTTNLRMEAKRREKKKL